MGGREGGREGGSDGGLRWGWAGGPRSLHCGSYPLLRLHGGCCRSRRANPDSRPASRDTRGGCQGGKKSHHSSGVSR